MEKQNTEKTTKTEFKKPELKNRKTANSFQKPKNSYFDRKNSNQGEKKPWGKNKKGGFSNEVKTKSESVLRDKPSYFNGRNNNQGGGSIPDALTLRPNRLNPVSGRGNLSVTDIGQTFTNQYIKSNSPETFDKDLPKTRIIPLGGLNEVGMNMTAIECGDDIIIVDTGFGFGGGDQYPGVDYIVPDTTYLEKNRHKIKGIFYTHGHLDHIGGAPYILPKIADGVAIFATELTAAMIKNRLNEFKMIEKYPVKVIPLDANITLGHFKIQLFRLNHSIPDTIGLAIDSPMGRILYTTDWKFDNTPYDNQFSDYGKIAKLGDEGVRVLLTDSLGAMKPGYSISELDIAKTVDNLFGQIKERIIFASFSSSIARLQHVITSAHKHGRKVALLGRSMVTNFNITFQMGKIKVPSGVVIDVRQAAKLPAHQVVYLCTGSQGEDNAALSRIARDEHPQIRIEGGDAVIFSSGMIPGNEDAIQELTSNLSRKGAKIYNKSEFDIHVSGHACHEDLKLMFSLARPEYVMPIHGEHFMLRKVCELANQVGVPTEKCLIAENGRVTDMLHDEIVVTDDVLIEGYVLVDGSGIGAVSNVVLDERRQMAKSGSLMVVFLVNKQKKLVGGPEIVSRGFVYMKNSQELFTKIKEQAKRDFNSISIDPKDKKYYAEIRRELKNAITKFVFNETEKEPVIIPVVVQV